MDDLNYILDDLKKTAIKDLISGDFDSAIEELKKGEVIDRENPEILFNLGIAYARKSLYKTAAEYFQKVLNLKTSYIDSAKVKKNLAFSLIQSNNFDSAMKYLDEVIMDYKSDIQSLNMRGYCIDKMGNHSAALKEYKKILKHDRNDLNALNSISYLMAKLDIDVESALKISKYIYSKNSTSAAYNDTLGYIYMKLGNYREAEKHLSYALSVFPFSNEIMDHIEELEYLKKI